MTYHSLSIGEIRILKMESLQKCRNFLIRDDADELEHVKSYSDSLDVFLEDLMD